MCLCAHLHFLQPSFSPPVCWEVNTTGSWGDLCLNLPRLETENKASAIQTRLEFLRASASAFFSKNIPQKHKNTLQIIFGSKITPTFGTQKNSSESTGAGFPSFQMQNKPWQLSLKPIVPRECAAEYWALLHNGWKKTKTRLSLWQCWWQKNSRVPFALGCCTLLCHLNDAALHHTAHYPPVATVLKMCKSELSGKVQFPACACSVTAALLDHPNTGAIIAAAPTPTPNLSFHNCTLDNAKFDNCTSLQTAHSSHHIWWWKHLRTQKPIV